MRILMVNKFLHPNGGSETYILKLGDALISQGHEVQYFGMEHQGRVVGNRAEAYTQDMDLHTASKAKQLIYALTTIYSAEARKKIRRVLEDFEPDVCHLNNFNFQLTPSILLEIDKWRRKSGKQCRIIYTAHDYQLICPNHMCNNPQTHKNCEKCIQGNYFHCVKGRCIHGSSAKSIIGTAEAYFWKIAGVYKLIDQVICCSEFIKTKLDCRSELAGKTVAQHNFIDQVKKEPDNEGKYVLYFGRYSKEKGVRTLLSACLQLKDIPFVFAGKGPLEKELEGISNIRNVGFKNEEELAGLIYGAKFTVCPSEWYENCPFSVMESQRYGVPVLGADIGGIPELIKDGINGEVFRSGDAEELTRKIDTLWHDEKRVKKFASQCGKMLMYLSASEYAVWIEGIYRGKALQAQLGRKETI